MSIKKADAEELRPLSWSEDKKQATDNEEVIELLDDVLIRIKSFLVRLESGKQTINDKFIEEVKASNKEELVHHLKLELDGVE